MVEPLVATIMAGGVNARRSLFKPKSPDLVLERFESGEPKLTNARQIIDVCVNV